MGKKYGDSALAHEAAEIHHPLVGLGLNPAGAQLLEEEVSGDAELGRDGPQGPCGRRGGYSPLNKPTVVLDVSGYGSEVQKGDLHAYSQADDGDGWEMEVFAIISSYRCV